MLTQVRPPLLLTGPPAAGKSTTAMALARAARAAAMIDVDDVRHLVVAGHAAPWEGQAGLWQQQLGVENACALTRRFLDVRIEVVLADLVTPATAALYRSRLPDLRVVRLRLPLDEARRRAQLRPVHLTEREFDHLHQLDRSSSFDVEASLEVAQLGFDEQVSAVLTLWDATAR